jgi:hypothetical protein
MSSNRHRDLTRASATRLCSGALAALASCGEADEAPRAPSEHAQHWFVECATELGVEFHHRSGHTERYYFPEIMTSGVALLDVEGDGDLDVYLVQGGSVLVDGRGIRGLRR